MGCSQCRGAAVDGGPCQPCGGGVRFSPGASGLTAPAVRVSGLEPYANYTFNVEAQNGVSGLGTSTPAGASLSISMGHAGEQSGQDREKPEGLRTTGTNGWAGSNRKATEVISSFLSKPTGTLPTHRVPVRPVPEAGEEGATAAGADLGRVPAPQPRGELELRAACAESGGGGG